MGGKREGMKGEGDMGERGGGGWDGGWEGGKESGRGEKCARGRKEQKRS